jgi:putative ABC transport system permease protein
MLRLALRNVTRQRMRTALTLAAIVLGVAGLIMAGGFVEDVYVQLGEFTIHSQLGHLQIYRKGYYVQGSRKPFEFGLERPDDLIRQLGANPAVQDAMLRLNFTGLLNNGHADLAIVGEGIEPDKEARLGSYLTLLQGRPLTAHDKYGMLVGDGVAKALSLAPGSRTTVVTSTKEGGLNSVDFEVVGVFRSFSKDYDNRAVRIPLAAAQDLVGADIANAAVVRLDTTLHTDQVKGELERSLVGRDLEIMSWHELSDFYEKTIALYKRQFGFLQLITLVMVIMSVMNSVSMTTFERVGEFGTMRALGDRSGTIFRLVLLENAVIGLVGATLGVALGLLLAVVLSRIGIPMPPPPNAESGYTAQIRIVPWTIAIAFAVGLTAAVAGAILPARRIARVPVVDALRQNV